MQDLSRHLAPLKNRVMGMLVRGLVAIVNDAAKIQKMQVTLNADEVRDDLEHFQNFGFRSNAPNGSEVICAFMGGNRDHGIVLLADNRQHGATNLKPGEAVMFSAQGASILMNAAGEIVAATGHGNTITMKADGTISIVSTVAVNVIAPVLHCTGDVSDAVGTMQQMRNTYNGHTHAENGTGGGTTSATGATM